MRVFVGYGYNDRDKWIEEQVFPVLEGMGLTVVHGKDMHGQVLQPEVQARIAQADVAVGFFTLRDGQGEADFTSHLWVRDEMVYANALNKLIIPIKQKEARVPDGLLGNRQYIELRQEDRLACVVELVRALGRRNMRRIRLEPESDDLRRKLHQWRNDPNFVTRYRTQDVEGLESAYRLGRLELVDQGFYLNTTDIPRRGYVEIDGLLNGMSQFNTGWASADAVVVKIS